MQLAYYVDEIRNLLPEDKKNLDTRLIIREINLQRALWLKNEMNKSRPITDSIKQTITNLRTELVDASEISNISSAMRLLRTVKQIPETVKRSHRDTIRSVRVPTLLSFPFNYITKDDAIYAGNGRFNRNEIFCFLYNRHIYFKLMKENPRIPLIDNISIEGVFVDPVDVIQNYTDYTGIFNARDIDYPIDDTIWEYIKGNILQHNAQVINSEIQENET